MTNDNQHIPSGYKPSPLGIIPEDWEVKRLGEVCTHFKSGNTITSKEITEKGLYPVYGGNGLRGYSNTYTHEGNYILIGRQGALCGNINYVEGKNYISEHAIAVQTNENMQWLKYKLENWNLNRFSESSAQPGLSVEKLVRYKLSVPTLKEQNKIADILSLWDAAIAKQTALIEQLTLRKRGLMQQLLTGKKRLKGFEGEWEEVKLGELLRETNELVGSRDIKPVSVGLLGIRLRSDVFDKELSSDYAKNKVLTKNQICFGLGTNQIVFDVLLSNNTYCVSPAYKTFCIEKCNPLLFKSLLSIYTSYLSKKHMIISARQGKSVDFDGLLSERIHIPTDKEQNVIASVLVNADKEIEIQKQKLEAMQKQKKGLMQVLLTGKKRIKK